MHVRKLPSGSWRWIVQHKGQKMSGTKPTKLLAEQAAVLAMVELGNSMTRASRRSVTVGDLLAVHLDQQDYAATTRQDLQRLVARLPSWVTSAVLDQVEPLTVEVWYSKLMREGWTVHRVRKLHMLLSSAWGRAFRYQWVKSRIMRDVEKPQAPEADVRPPTDAEVRAVLDHVEGSVALYLRLAAVTGARRGELVGLQWGDVALDSGTLVLRRSVANVAGMSGPVVSSGKTGKKGHRVVAVDAGTAGALRDHRRAMVELALEAGLPSPLWVFSHDAGVSPWRGDYISREFRRARARAGVSGVRLHDLRHFMATSMLAAGVPATVVQQRLGHRSLTTTTKVYGHYVQAVDQDAASALGAVL